MQSSRFFKTEQVLKTEQEETYSKELISRKSDLRSYVSHLDHHINKAMGSQNRTIGRKRQNLLQTLEKMKDQINKQSEKSRKMQEFFYQHCEKILVTDINKWDNNKDFFTKVFQLYDAKIKQKQSQINKKKSEVQGKKIQLKQMLKNLRRSSTIQQLSQRLQKQKQERSQSKNKKTLETSTTLRIKTESSLPSLSKGLRIKTLTNYEQQDGVKSYMKPIKTVKTLEDSNLKEDLIDMLNWYRTDKSEYSWFEKMVFLDRNYKKIQQYILSTRV